MWQVLAQPSVELQEEEMRLWFKAFQEQDPSVRDYRKYFKVCQCLFGNVLLEASKSCVKTKTQKYLKKNNIKVKTLLNIIHALEYIF